MNILFDQTEAQTLFYNGAAEYAQSVFFKMISLLKEYPDVNIYSLYHSGKRFRYEQLSCESLRQYERVFPVDYKNETLKDIVKKYDIDLSFITCAQSFCDLPVGDLQNIGCKVISVIHDLCDEETEKTRLLHFQYLCHPLKLVRLYMSRLKTRLMSGNFQIRSRQMIGMLNNNNADIITVSDYSRKSIIYNYPQLHNRIHVLASPAKKINTIQGNIKNNVLKSLIDKKERYFLLLSADRVLKNAERTIHAFNTFNQLYNMGYKLVTIGWGKKEFDNHIPLPFLSAEDLEMAYMHCHALIYPSLFEGFGYPPLEAMKYSKPILCSNVCSMPEILGRAPIYFSPIYETDIFKALVEFTEASYNELSKRCFKQYQEVSEKQIKDLDILVRSIMNGTFLTKN